MNARENKIRAYRFQGPEWIPVAAGFAPLAWDHYDPNDLEELMLGHPLLFPGYVRGSIYPDNVNIPPDMFAGRPYTDGWGCVWETSHTGMVGTVTTHPLERWESFENFCPPDPGRHNGMYPLDWESLREGVRQARAQGAFIALGLPHGHTFLRMQDLRGYQNFIYDMAEEHPSLAKLVSMVESFNVTLIERFLDLGPDMVAVPEDLGMQRSPMLSPAMFKRYIKPSYMRMMGLIRGRGALVHLHSDGHILDLADDLLECGCDVLNLQDLVNGIDNIRRTLKGRVAIDLDVDRQNVTHAGSPGDVTDLIREEIEKLGSKEGGLSLCYQPWPPAPIENIRAAFTALERFCTYYA